MELILGMRMMTMARSGDKVVNILGKVIGQHIGLNFLLIIATK